MASTKTSATATIVQAAEQVVLTEATTIAKTIGTKNAADLKTIVKGVAQEGLAATDHDASTVLENIVDGVEVVAGEVVKGAEKTVEAVENHPELIAKGALALGIGVVSIVQPELALGAVALVGKMASDATKETINEIVVESSTSVVKGVAIEVTEETAELNDLTGDSKAVVQQGSTAISMEKPASTDTAPGEQKSAPVAAVDAKAIAKEVAGEMTDIEAAKTSQNGKEIVASSEVPGTSTSDDLLKTASSKLEADIKDSAARAEAESSKTIADSDPVKPEPVEESAAAEKVEDQDHTDRTEEHTAAMDPNDNTKSAEPKLAADIKKSEAKAEAESSKSVADTEPVKSEAVMKSTGPDQATDQVETDKTKESPPGVDANGSMKEGDQKPEPEKKDPVVEQAPILSQLGIVHSEGPAESESKAETKTEEQKKETNGAKSTEPGTTDIPRPSNVQEPTEKQPEITKDATPKDIPSTAEATVKPKPQSTSPTNGTNGSQLATPPPPPSLDPATKKGSPQPATPETGSHIQTHAAVLSAHAKINGLQQSHELLHQKLDTMQTALLAITKVLSERPPAPSPPQPSPSPPAEPEPQATEHNRLVLANPAAVNKRLSVFGSIGWLFGAGSGSTKGKGDGKAKHNRCKFAATSTPATVGESSV